MTKKFTEWTREELIEGIIEFIDPEIVGFRDIVSSFNLDKEEGAFLVMLRDGKYLRADVDWTYWDNLEEPEWVEIPREAFIELLHENMAEESLNQLRLLHRRNYLDQKLVRQITFLEEDNETLRESLLQYNSLAKKILWGEK